MSAKESESAGQRAERLYSELIELAREVVSRLQKSKPVSGLRIVEIVSRIVEEISSGSKELVNLTNRSTPDNYLYGHLANVCILSVQLGMGLGYGVSALNELGVAAFLYDLGMVKFLDIINKPERLKEEEFEKIKEHTNQGQEILTKIEFIPRICAQVALQHHERGDKSGYPQGLGEKDICEYAKIIGLVDVYSALTHPRPQRRRFPALNALKELQENKTLFKPKLLEILLRQITPYPLGSWVWLNTLEIAQVVGVNEGFPLQPRIKILFKADGSRWDRPQETDLIAKENLYIERLLTEKEMKSRGISPEEII